MLEYIATNIKAKINSPAIKERKFNMLSNIHSLLDGIANGNNAQTRNKTISKTLNTFFIKNSARKPNYPEGWLGGIAAP